MHLRLVFPLPSLLLYLPTYTYLPIPTYLYLPTYTYLPPTSKTPPVCKRLFQPQYKTYSRWILMLSSSIKSGTYLSTSRTSLKYLYYLPPGDFCEGIPPHKALDVSSCTVTNSWSWPNLQVWLWKRHLHIKPLRSYYMSNIVNFITSPAWYAATHPLSIWDTTTQNHLEDTLRYLSITCYYAQGYSLSLRGKYTILHHLPISPQELPLYLLVLLHFWAGYLCGVCDSLTDMWSRSEW